MGLFGNSKTKQIQEIIYKISTGFAQVDDELGRNNNQATPMAKGILIALQKESDTLYSLVCPNRRTDWNLVNSTQVRLHDGSVMLLGDYLAGKFHNKGLYLYRLTGINVAFNL